jgi:3-hydroxyisobutyrate dehydrogenase
VGVIGTGNMGAPMVLRLVERGWRLVVRDLRSEAEAPLAAAGATVAASPAELAAACDWLMLVVVDAGQLNAVLFDGPQPAAPCLRAGQIVLVHSTVAPDQVRALAERLAPTGAVLLDAPISGGPARARTGTLSLMLSGAPAARERAAPLLADLASAVFTLGEAPGQAAAMKLVNNLLAGVHLAAAAQAFALGERAGLSREQMLAVTQASSGQSWIAGERLGRWMQGDRAARSQAKILAKDMHLAADWARASGADASLGAEARAVFEAVLAAGLGEQDDAVLFDALSAAASRAGGAAD